MFPGKLDAVQINPSLYTYYITQGWQRFRNGSKKKPGNGIKSLSHALLSLIGRPGGGQA
jgi:hypothetical protein